MKKLTAMHRGVLGIAALTVLIATLALALALPRFARADCGAAAPDPNDPFLMGNDVVWFGSHLELEDYELDNDLIAAGQTVDLKEVAAPGSIRAAAQSITMDDSSAAQSITVAGQHVSLTNTEATVIAIAAQEVSVSGACSELTVYAETVFIDGTVYGDAMIGAKTVEIGPNANIEGTLHVSAEREPVVQRGAEVEEVAFSQTGESCKEDEGTAPDAGAILSVVLAVVSIMGTLVVAILAEWLFGHHTDAAATMARTRTGALVGTGVIGTLAAPIVAVILLVLVLTAPVAIALTCALLAMAVVAGGFAGASLLRLAAPKLGRFKRALAGGAIVGVAGALPILGTIVHAVAFAFMLGYVLQGIFLGLRDRSRAHDSEPPSPPEQLPPSQ